MTLLRVVTHQAAYVLPSALSYNAMLIDGLRHPCLYPSYSYFVANNRPIPLDIV